MPADNVVFMKRNLLLSFEEIERIARIGTSLGIDRLRLTGGEPLVRRDLHLLVEKLTQLPGIRDVGITTNGILLADQAQSLFDAGLRRLNVSLDAFTAEKFREITRRDGFENVIAGIHAARRVGFEHIKINAVAIRGMTEDELLSFGRFARETNVEVRFIEFMPLDADNAWEREKVLFAHEIIERLSRDIMPLKALPGEQQDQTAPATRYQFQDGTGRIGIIASVSRPFCASCNRFRMTADGKLRNCLFSLEETDIREMLRSGSGDSEIAEAMVQSIQAKKEGHEINTARFIQPDRPMYSIGG